MRSYFYSIKFITLALVLITILLINSPAISETNSDIPEDGIILLDDDMDLIQLIQTVSEISNETYVLDESVKPKEIHIITPEGGMKNADLLKFFDVILNLNGLSVVRSGDINKIVNSTRIKEENTPTIVE